MEKKWKLLKSEPIYESKWLSLFDNTYELPNGKIGEHYLHVKRPDYVLIIAMDDLNNIVVERNYRRGVDDFVFELPAGWIEPGESIQDAAKRELKEETGFIGNTEILGEFYPEPGFLSMKAYVAFISIKNEKKGESNLSEDEDIKYELMNLSAIKQLIKENTIKDMGFLTALQIFEVSRNS